MMYKTETGFAAIRRMEPDTALKNINEPLLSGGASDELTIALTGGLQGEVKATVGDSIEKILSCAGTPLEDLELKFVHVGAPLGVFLGRGDLGKTLAEIVAMPGVSLGSLTFYVGSSKDCSVAYTRSILENLKEESCGRCVLCRLGIDQLIRIFRDASDGKGRADDLATLRTLVDAMRKAAFCRFGKATGALLESYCSIFSTEFEDHTKRKKCSAMVCEKYLTYIILPNLCTGCGDCMDECDEDAITGKPRFIHMIDEYDCTRCGKCAKVCEEEAIVIAGAIKPKLPTKLTKVGMWKGK